MDMPMRTVVIEIEKMKSSAMRRATSERLRKSSRATIICAAAFFALIGICGCVNGNTPLEHPTEVQTEDLSVPLGAKSVHIELKLAAGELTIDGGSPKLMNGTIQYNMPDWRPTMNYRVSDGQGMLTVAQPENSHSSTGNVTYTWNLNLNNTVPTDLHVEMGAGKANMNFAGMDLRRLHLEMGAGESNVDLSGDWKHNLDVNLEGGVGKVSVKLPREVGVRATVQGALGTIDAPDFKKEGDTYENDAYGKSIATINLQISGGIGKVTLELAGARPIV